MERTGKVEIKTQNKRLYNGGGSLAIEHILDTATGALGWIDYSKADVYFFVLNDRSNPPKPKVVVYIAAKALKTLADDTRQGRYGKPDFFPVKDWDMGCQSLCFSIPLDRIRTCAGHRNYAIWHRDEHTGLWTMER